MAGPAMVRVNDAGKAADGNVRGTIAGAVSTTVGILVPRGLRKLAPEDGGLAGAVGKKFNDFLGKSFGAGSEQGTEALICY